MRGGTGSHRTVRIYVLRFPPPSHCAARLSVHIALCDKCRRETLLSLLAGIIEAGCDVFGIDRPAPDNPTVRGLLDPCTNSKRFPNIPAEARSPCSSAALGHGRNAAIGARIGGLTGITTPSAAAAAQKLYDKYDDGLLLRNTWAGSFVILNPPFESQLQWRFVNRVIDEVEGGRCTGALLICRNSTDTSYFQRLKPYPRVFLRRDAVQCAR